LLETHAAELVTKPVVEALQRALAAVWRKYITQPVVKLFTSQIIRACAISWLRRVMRRSRSFAPDFSRHAEPSVGTGDDDQERTAAHAGATAFSERRP
jgi:hypothetical protein